MIGRFTNWLANRLCGIIGVLTVGNNKGAEHRNWISDLLEKVLYPISRFFQAQKAKNRKLYYFVKHLLIVLLLVWIIL